MGLVIGSSYKWADQDKNMVRKVADCDWIARTDEILHFTAESFQVISGLGKGKFGLVYLAKHNGTHKCVAIKYITKNAIFQSKRLEKFQEEFEVLQEINHVFIANCFGGFETSTCFGLVCELAAGGELYNRLKKVVKLPELEAKFYFCELCCVLRYLHDEKHLVYRDLKPENILIDHRGHIKLCDFGFATTVRNVDDDDLKDGCGTVMYIAPEVASGFMKGTHGFPVDWWALGCVLMEMVTGEAPFGDSDSLSKFEIFNNITEKTVTFPLFMSSSLKQLLKGLLDKNPVKRFAWQQINLSSWTEHVKWADVEAQLIIPPWIPPLSGREDTQNFLKWDFTLPREIPASDVQQYCRPLQLPRIRRLSIDDRNESAKAPVGSPVVRGLSRKMSSSTMPTPEERDLSPKNKIRSPSRQRSELTGKDQQDVLDRQPSSRNLSRNPSKMGSRASSQRLVVPSS